MGSWFGRTSEQYFELFSISHIIMLLLYFAGLGLLLILFTKEKNNGLTTIVRWMLFSLLLVSEVSYQTWAIAHSIWNASSYLPLHLCGIASITAMLALATKNTYLVHFSFFIGLVPAFLALITPELPYNYQHFRFWKFFIHHIAISWSSLFVLLHSKHKLRGHSVIFSYATLVVYAIFIGVWINPSLRSNYLFLSTKPTANTPLNMLGSGTWYYINLGLLALLIFSLQYFIYRSIMRKRNSFYH